MSTLHWGILGTAGIARKNWRAIHDSGNGVVAAVGSRGADRSRQFIAECQAQRAFEHSPAALGSYEEVLRSPDIDAIYIPLPTGIRKEWVLRAAAAGKHVLCEKPCGLDANDVREMIDTCRRHRVQFMDGVMFMHNRRMDRMRELLDDGEMVGGVKRIMTIFTFRAVEGFFDANIRVHSELEPTGCLGDLGWYCIRIALWTTKWRLPREVAGRILSQRGNRNSPGAAPTDFSGELIFDDESSAGFYCSFLAESQQWVDISGTRGQLRLSDFVHPLSDHEPVIEVRRQAVPVKCCDCEGEHSESRALAQDANMFRNFARQVKSGELNMEWPEIALKTQQVMDACYRSAKDEGRLIPIS